MVGGSSFGDALGMGLRDGAIGGVTGGLIGGVAGGIDAVKDGRRFFDGYKVEKNTLVDLHLKEVRQIGDWNCGPSCVESIDDSFGGGITQHDARRWFGGNPNVDGIADARLWDSYRFRTGRAWRWVHNNESPFNVLDEMRSGARVALTRNQHSVAVSRIVQKVVTKPNGSSIRQLMFYVMDPAKGKIVRLPNTGIWNAANLFYIF